MTDVRPHCPTCDGGREVFVGVPHHLRDCDCTWDQTPCAQTVKPCPDCVDGKVAIEQLVATYNAVAGQVAHYDEHYPMGDGLTEIGRACRELVNRLWSVKP